MRVIKRSTEEYILLALCLAGTIGIFPFAIYRYINSQWLLSSIDAVLVLGVVVIGVYVWKSRKIRSASIVLTLFYMIGMVAVIYVEGPALIYWTYPTMTAAYFLLRPKEAAIVNLFALVILIPVLGAELETIVLSSFLVTIFLNNIFAFIFANRMQMQHEELTRQATRDSLTGIGNRRLFDEKVRECVALRQRKQQKTTLIILDIDHFKKINDTFGHVIYGPAL